ncbi:DMT family transporter [Arthrobacter sp. zg-Y1143]|uniref:DMT family transporter n=1 Tax=Arthrobacter sp. zg-Y1143 TaxID=3049065 RepID=UPI0024C34E20|nr:DMT family transporter [Arthrobacter sp. zg-Y1143]MDK1327520.1 DMT family transporter [Arthrobacter sp. zg-Y1143]
MQIHKENLNHQFIKCPLVLSFHCHKTGQVTFPSPRPARRIQPARRIRTEPRRLLFSLLSARRVDLLLLMVAVVWGSSYLAAKTLTETVGVTVILSLRFLITTLALALIWLVGNRRRPGRRETLVGVVLGLTQAAVLLLETQGISGTSATNAGLIISLVIVFTPVTESLAFRVPLPRMVFVAGVVAVVGVCLLVSGDGFAAPTLGDLLVLAAAVVRSIHVTAVSGLTRGRGHSALNLTLMQSAVCAVVYSAADHQGVLEAVRSFDAGEWMGVLYLGLACSVFAFLVQAWAIQQTSASRASLLMGTEPIWAVLIGITIGREALPLPGIAGAALIITGTYLGLRSETRHRAATSPAKLDAVGTP